MTKSTINSPKEKLIINKFLMSLNEKKYSLANKFLKKIVEVKMNKRMAKIINNL